MENLCLSGGQLDLAGPLKGPRLPLQIRYIRTHRNRAVPILEDQLVAGRDSNSLVFCGIRARKVPGLHGFEAAANAEANRYRRWRPQRIAQGDLEDRASSARNK